MALPTELTARPQWVLWRLEDVGHPNFAKVRTGRGTRAGATDSATSHPSPRCGPSTRPTRSGGAGLGYVFTTDDPFVGIDLDACREPRTGALTREALAIIRPVGSFTPRRRAGIGVHILVAASAPELGRRTDQVECCAERPVLHLYGPAGARNPATIEQRDDTLAAWWAETFPPRPPERGRQPLRRPSSAWRTPMSWPWRLQRGERRQVHRSAGAMGRAWGTPASPTPTIALCGLLAFYTGGAMGRSTAYFASRVSYRGKCDGPRGPDLRRADPRLRREQPRGDVHAPRRAEQWGPRIRFCPEFLDPYSAAE